MLDMAAVGSVPRLIEALRSADGLQHPHAWIEGGALALGAFPVARMSYDFAAEKFVVRGNETKEKRRESRVHLAARDTYRHYEIETEETIFEFASATQALLHGLEIIEGKAQGTLDMLCCEKGRSKRPVARTRDELYDLPSQRKYAEKLSTGHFVATNNKSDESLEVLRRAAILGKLSKDQFTVRRRSR